MAPGGDNMIHTVELNSWLSEQIGRFIELRRLSGTDYSSQARLLGYFDHFLIAHYSNRSFITRTIIDHYMKSLSCLRYMSSKLSPKLEKKRRQHFISFCDPIMKKCHRPAKGSHGLRRAQVWPILGHENLLLLL